MKIPKNIKIIIITVVALFALLIFISIIEDKPKEAPKEEAVIDNSIKGLSPADIYSALEKRGYTITKKHSREWGNLYACQKSEAGIDYLVDISGDSKNPVDEVRATAMINGSVPTKNIIAAKPFIEYISTAPYEGSDSKKVVEWIEKNYNKDKSTIEVSGVKFTIYAPTKFLRMLIFKKN